MLVDSGAGAINLGVCYCDTLYLDSQGGDVAVAHLNCQGESGPVSLDAGGGKLSLGGLDGRAELQSDGGDLDIQVRCVTS